MRLATPFADLPVRNGGADPPRSARPKPQRGARAGLVQKLKLPATPTDRTARARDPKGTWISNPNGWHEQKNRRSKISKPNLPRSKNNPSGERNDPDIDWSRYAEGSKSECRNYVEWMGKIADYIRKPLGILKGERDGRV